MQQIQIKINSDKIVATTKKEIKKAKGYLKAAIVNAITEYNNMTGKEHKFVDFHVERINDDWLKNYHTVFCLLEVVEEDIMEVV